MQLDLNVQLENQFEEKLTPGIHVVDINNVEEKESGGKDYIEVEFVNTNGKHTERLYVTDNAKDYTMYKLQQICLASGYSMDQIAMIKNMKQLGKALTGKKIALKLSGQEKEFTKDGSTSRFIIAYVGLGKFCTSIEAKDSLVFKTNNRGEKGDIKYLPDSPKQTEVKTTEAAKASSDNEDDLPF